MIASRLADRHSTRDAMHGANGRPGLRSGALAAAFGLLAQGCSLIFVRPLRSQETTEAPRCTESAAAPLLDTLVASVALTIGASALGVALSHNDKEGAGRGFATLSALVLVLTAASAIYGFHQISRCREATTSWCASHDCGEPDAIR